MMTAKKTAETEIDTPDFDVDALLDTAKTRWLRTDEIIALLSPRMTDEYGQEHRLLELAVAPPSSPPPSGTIILYDRLAVRNYKADGYVWTKKRCNPNKVREDHVKLRYNGTYRVDGTYVHCANLLTLHRRAYRLIKDKEEGGGKDTSSTSSYPQDIVLVHYLDTDEASRLSSGESCSSKKRKSSNDQMPCRETKRNQTAFHSTGETNHSMKMMWSPSMNYTQPHTCNQLAGDEDSMRREDTLLRTNEPFDILWDMIAPDGTTSAVDCPKEDPINNPKKATNTAQGAGRDQQAEDIDYFSAHPNPFGLVRGSENGAQPSRDYMCEPGPYGFLPGSERTHDSCDGVSLRGQDNKTGSERNMACGNREKYM